ncbi:MAG: LAGLIDADG family homing endonuclease [Anaerolineaceae bacterium]|nr:LAGLIDADG family homing endonuclease [Anaerolineaceae bacterium]MDD5367533.1 LAGLIDADG family homing endonuclease [Anaerolineaceae bacterium]
MKIGNLDLHPLWLAWFVGFVDGEGYFKIGKSKTNVITLELVIEQREDNKSVITEIAKQLRCGKIYYLDMNYDRVKGRRSCNKYRWRCTPIRDIVDILIPIFDLIPLRTKKLDDYQIWREAALIKDRKSNDGSPAEIERLGLLRDAMMHNHLSPLKK